MKKVLFLVLGLALLSGGVFAADLPEGLKISGSIKTGVQVSGSTIDDNDYDADTGASDPIIKGYSDDLDNGEAFRTDLNIVYEKGDFGIKTRFRVRTGGDGIGNWDNPFSYNQDLGSAKGGLEINKAFVYGNLFDKKVKFSIGHNTDEAWSTRSFSFDANSWNTGFDGKDGIKFEVKPIDGLNVGFHLGSQKAGNSNVFDGFGNGYPNYFVVGAKYDQSLFGVTLAAKMNNGIRHEYVDGTADNISPYRGDPTIGNGTYEYSVVNGVDSRPQFLANISNANNFGDNKGYFGTFNFLLSLAFKGTDDLPLYVGLDLVGTNVGAGKSTIYYKSGVNGTEWKTEEWTPETFVLAALKAEFGVSDALKVGLKIKDMQFADTLYTKDASEDDQGNATGGFGLFFPITFNPYAEYKLNDQLTCGFDLGFHVNQGGSSQFGFTVKPSATFDLGNGAKFVVYDEIGFYNKSHRPWNEDDGKLNSGSRKHPFDQNFAELGGSNGTKNTLQFDFVYSF